MDVWQLETGELRYRKSVDEGLTWLPEKKFPTEKTGFTVAANGILLDNGTMMFGVTNSADPGYLFGKINIVSSFDNGETWRFSEDIKSDDGTLLREPTLTTLNNGDVLAYTRPCGAGGFGFGSAPKGGLRIWEMRSKDGGRSWSQPKPTSVVNNDSTVSLITWHTGELILAHNNTANPGFWVSRYPLDIAYSPDDGTTWLPLYRVDPGPGNVHWPSVIEGSDGLLHIVYSHLSTAICHVALELS